MKQNGYTLIEMVITLLLLVIIPAAIFGWIWNIVKLVAMGLDPITGLLVVRVVGIFLPPIGAVVGYL